MKGDGSWSDSVSTDASRMGCGRAAIGGLAMVCQVQELND